jgi:hypothetical protein
MARNERNLVGVLFAALAILFVAGIATAVVRHGGSDHHKHHVVAGGPSPSPSPTQSTPAGTTHHGHHQNGTGNGSGNGQNPGTSNGGTSNGGSSNSGSSNGGSSNGGSSNGGSSNGGSSTPSGPHLPNSGLASGFPVLALALLGCAALAIRPTRARTRDDLSL